MLLLLLLLRLEGLLLALETLLRRLRELLRLLLLVRLERRLLGRRLLLLLPVLLLGHLLLRWQLLLRRLHATSIRAARHHLVRVPGLRVAEAVHIGVRRPRLLLHHRLGSHGRLGAGSWRRRPRHRPLDDRNRLPDDLAVLLDELGLLDNHERVTRLFLLLLPSHQPDDVVLKLRGEHALLRDFLRQHTTHEVVAIGQDDHPHGPDGLLRDDLQDRPVDAVPGRVRVRAEELLHSPWGQRHRAGRLPRNHLLRGGWPGNGGEKGV
mmetsp:Transcript_19536/g.55990  ORF Transcript_19536/g.55990 Transcript_19536/m.55990 type:complete len:265 (-) Transcript_19536:3-797(-)